VGLAYADDVNLLGNNIDTITRNKETLIDASMEVGLHGSAEQKPDVNMWHSSHILERK
jgi:hypothetical protein